MIDAPSVFHLAVENGGCSDGSPTGVAILRSANVAIHPDTQGVDLANGSLELARNPALDGLQTFTIAAMIHPAAVGGHRRTIIEGETPPIALYIDPLGSLVGEVNTDAGRLTVASGATRLEADHDYRVRFSRDAAGNSELELDDRVVGRAVIPGRLQASGEAGLAVGGRPAVGDTFDGRIANLDIASGLVDRAARTQREQEADRISHEFVAATGIAHVVVSLLPDESHTRLQPIKQIMAAAGVQRISDLDTLRLSVPTTMTPGRVLLAARKPALDPVQWAGIVTAFRQSDVAHRQVLLAEHLTNRNSASILEGLGAVRVPPDRERPEEPGRPGRPGRAPRPGERERPLPGAELPAVEQVERRLRTPRELFDREGGQLRLVDLNILDSLETIVPSAWPILTAAPLAVQAPATIPVGSSVIIAGTLDLTNTTLLVEPSVTTLYIIADEIVCGPNATITWKRPGGHTPDRLSNPDLNGRGFPGMQTKPDSLDGLDGEDGLPGANGMSGARGRTAPALEIWTRHMTGMPDLDVTGEPGIRGGRGQPGGDGGCGGNGHPGKWWWFFGTRCWSEGGDGGDGGYGGRGGDGGRGGGGGDGGRIAIGVLEGTLAATVTNHPFKIMNAGGAVGEGGLGGSGGSGGAPGSSGNADPCWGADDGHPGADGQPGALGAHGIKAGAGGQVDFFEFTDAAWNDLLTRPWLTDIVPTSAFPGDRIVLRGSRFSPNDRVQIDGRTFVPIQNADESISVDLPIDTTGGQKTVFVRRPDGTESNRLAVWVKPQLDALVAPVLMPGATIDLAGRAFLPNASVLVDGAATPAVVADPGHLTFQMPGTGGTGSNGGTAILAVRNPDGLVSNPRQASKPHILEVPFRFDHHALSFANFDDGVPDWGTYEDTFGSAEVWHEQLDPLFGHPILTALYFGFYKYFLKGKSNGGLATGFCTSLASLVADRFWQGYTDAPTLTKADNHRMLTAVHGKLLSRESLLTLHDQGLQGDDRVEQTYREIETTFLRGCDRQNAPLLFFIPSGDIWDSGYFDKLADSHCVMPYRFVYPGQRGPQLSADGKTTLTDPDGVALYVWDCNHPASQDARLVFRRTGGRILFDYFPGGNQPQFRSEDGITLGMWTNGGYHLADHDLPFSGPFGLTSFVIDFLMSPADLQVTDDVGRRTGTFGGRIFAEIPDSHPAYLVKGAYLLPARTALTRRIVGTGAGQYTYSTILPDGASIALEGVTTAPGDQDVVAISADGTQLRITPSANKAFGITLAREINGQARAIAISNIGGDVASPIDITVSPELSLLRVGNRGADRVVEVRAFAIDRTANPPLNRQLPNVALPANHDLAVSVADWTIVDVTADAVAF